MRAPTRQSKAPLTAEALARTPAGREVVAEVLRAFCRRIRARHAKVCEPGGKTQPWTIKLMQGVELYVSFKQNTVCWANNKSDDVTTCEAAEGLDGLQRALEVLLR